MKRYQHLCNEERFYIHQAVREGKTQKEIAKQLNRSPSTICREMKRNMWPSAYLYTYEWAKHFVRCRKKYRANNYEKKIDDTLGKQIEELIKYYLSPQQVSGYLACHMNINLSHETIYRYIYSCKKRKLELSPFLRQGNKKRRKKYGSGARASKIPNRKAINLRPEVVETKNRVGDWECDTVIGEDRKCVLVTLVERKTLFTLIARVKVKTAYEVSTAIIKSLQPYIDKVKTLTFDNGSEFVQHEKIAEALNATTYFANPYCSWERGINENTNGLIRQFFPKCTDFRKVHYTKIRKVMRNLNNRPRKTRGYKTPNELFNNEFVPLI